MRAENDFYSIQYYIISRNNWNIVCLEQVDEFFVVIGYLRLKYILQPVVTNDKTVVVIDITNVKLTEII